MFSKFRSLSKSNIYSIKSKLFNNTTNYNKELLDHITIIKNNFKNSNNDESLRFILDYRSIIEYRNYDIKILVNELKTIDNILKSESVYNLFNRFLEIKRVEKMNNYYKKYYMTDKIIYSGIGILVGIVVVNL